MVPFSTRPRHICNPQKKMKEFQHQIKIPKGVMFDEIVGPDGETIRVIRALSPEATIFITQRERWVWLEGSKHGVFTACQVSHCARTL